MGDREVVLLPGLPVTAPLYARALLPRGAGATLPTRTLLVTGHRQDASRLAAYNEVCGFVLRDRVPATWLHVLTFPLQLSLLAGRDFPVAMTAVVHAGNRMTLHRPVAAGEELTLAAEVGGARSHRRGVMFELVSRVSVGDEPVWEGHSDYLALGARLPGLGDASADPVREPAALPTAGVWRLPAGLGRRYAAVSGDVNPIHLNPLVARALGFPRAIIHGMWTHARLLAALDPRLPESYSAEVAFLKPILLPSTVRLGARRTEDGYEVAVTSRDGSRDHVRASVHS